MEWQKYSAYGVPFLLTPGDHGKDGGIAAADQTAFNADYAANNARADLNRDGAWTTADQTLFTASYNAAAAGGRWKLSTGDVCNRKGYAGYEHEGFGNDLAAVELAHVRNRVLHIGLGRWTRRDPLGYVDGMSLLGYASLQPIRSTDAMGLASIAHPGAPGALALCALAGSPLGVQIAALCKLGYGPAMIALLLGVAEGCINCAQSSRPRPIPLERAIPRIRPISRPDHDQCWNNGSGGCSSGQPSKKRCNYFCDRDGTRREIYIICPYQASDPPCPPAISY